MRTLHLFQNFIIFFKIHFFDLLVEHFDNHLKETFCINYVLKQKEIYDNIFGKLEEMKDKKNWDEYHPVIYK